jgi:hypothetical protein
MTQPKSKNRVVIERKVNAVKATAAVYGAYAGLLGMEHGYFETLQGNLATKSLKIMAAGFELPFPFGHEPAMTVIPNFLATGIVAMLVGLAIIVWSALFVQKKHGAAILLLLSIALLFFGGGFGPISLLIIACIGAGRIDKPLKWWQRCLPGSLSRVLARLWYWSFAAALLWVPLEFVLGQIFHLRNDHSQTLTNLNLLLCYPMLGLFALTLIAGFAHEIDKQVGIKTWG